MSLFHLNKNQLQSGNSGWRWNDRLFYFFLNNVLDLSVCGSLAETN